MTEPAERLRAWSRRRAEPEWLTRRRLEALSRLDPKDPALPDLWAALDEPVGRLSPVPPELAEQGVEVLPTAEAAARGWANSLWGAGIEATAVEAFWTGGVFARVPRRVEAVLPLHVSAGLKRFGAVERSAVVLEEGASLEYVEGCTELGGRPGRRWSLFEAWVGAGARLSGATVQAWPFGTRSWALKRLRVADRGRLDWADANLWAERLEKTIDVELGARATADVLCGGFAADGQAQSLALAARPEAGAQLEVLAASRGSGRVEAGCPRFRRWAGGTDESLHAFFEPLARRLPLEFSVEFSRLLDAAILD